MINICTSQFRNNSIRALQTTHNNSGAALLHNKLRELRFNVNHHPIMRLTPSL